MRVYVVYEGVVQFTVTKWVAVLLRKLVKFTGRQAAMKSRATNPKCLLVI